MTSLKFLSAVAVVGVAGSAWSATIVKGDVTTGLGPNFFVDDASTGGGDATVNQPSVGQYKLDFGALNVGAGGTQVTVTGVGWASPNFAGIDLTQMSVTITYLGLDGVGGGGDDVVLGSTSDVYPQPFQGAGEYYWIFDTPISGTVDGLNQFFRVDLAPINATGDGSMRFKTFSTTNFAPKLSVAGTSEAVAPEPGSLALIALGGLCLARRRRGGE